MKETVCLVSLGCPKNLVDSEVILGLLSKEGYSLTTDPLRAEILIVNTCSFIEDATKEAIENLSKILFNSPILKKKVVVVFSLFLDASLNDMGKFWKRNCRKWITSLAPETSKTFPSS